MYTILPVVLPFGEHTSEHWTSLQSDVAINATKTTRLHSPSISHLEEKTLAMMDASPPVFEMEVDQPRMSTLSSNSAAHIGRQRTAAEVHYTTSSQR